MIVYPVLITLGILGGLYALREPGPPALPTPPPTPPPPLPGPNPSPPGNPFEGLPYGAIVRLKPEKNVFGSRGGRPDVVKIVGETNPGSPFSSYLAIDTACFVPDTLCPRRTVLDSDIAERVS